MKTVLFACVHNAGRSQMASAFFNALADETKARAISAGTQPGLAVYPEVRLVMSELGLDLGGSAPRLLSDEVARTAQLLVTMGCGEACPYVPGLKRDDWGLPDPKGRPLTEVRKIRDDIRAHVLALLTCEGWLKPSTHSTNY